MSWRSWIACPILPSKAVGSGILGTLGIGGAAVGSGRPLDVGRPLGTGRLEVGKGTGKAPPTPVSVEVGNGTGTPGTPGTPGGLGRFAAAAMVARKTMLRRMLTGSRPRLKIKGAY